MGLFSAIGSAITAGKQRRAARKINPVNARYEVNPFIKNIYSEGRNLYQGRMLGAAQAEQNIANAASNTRASAERNATDASQLLGVSAAAQGQANQSYVDLSTTESQDKQNRFGIYSNVSQLRANEDDKVFQDKLRNYYDDLNYKRALEGAAMQNQANFWGGLDDVANTAVSLFVPGGALAKGVGGGSRSLSMGMQQGMQPNRVSLNPGNVMVDPNRYSRGRLTPNNSAMGFPYIGG